MLLKQRIDMSEDARATALVILAAHEATIAALRAREQGISLRDLTMLSDDLASATDRVTITALKAQLAEVNRVAAVSQVERLQMADTIATMGIQLEAMMAIAAASAARI